MTPWDQGEVPLRNWPLLGPKNWQLSLGLHFAKWRSGFPILSTPCPLRPVSAAGIFGLGRRTFEFDSSLYSVDKSFEMKSIKRNSFEHGQKVFELLIDKVCK